MRRCQKHFFNMIEIALAIAVIAIGVSSIMVLFPVGLNATKSAMADNNIPDAAEYLMSYIEARVVGAWRDSSGAPIANTFIQGLPSSKVTTNEPTTWTAIPDLDISVGNPVVSGFFLFSKVSTLSGGGTVTDFSAVAMVWRESAFFHDTVNNTYVALSPLIGITVNLELSWPADRPYKDREKRLYKLTVFNPAATPADIP